jgi:hypothetical protein
MMSLLLADLYIHEISYNISDFTFLIHDINEMANYDKLYDEEQDLLLNVLRIFGEFARTRRICLLNIEHMILPVSLKILMDDKKFKKEVRMWALIILDRSCSHKQEELAERVLK